MRTTFTTCLAALLLASAADGAGFAHNANFLVFTPADPSQEVAQEFAQELLAVPATARPHSPGT